MADAVSDVLTSAPALIAAIRGILPLARQQRLMDTILSGDLWADGDGTCVKVVGVLCPFPFRECSCSQCLGGSAGVTRMADTGTLPRARLP